MAYCAQPQQARIPMFSEVSAQDLTGAQKAAIIVRLISGDGGTIPIASLSASSQSRIAMEFEGLGKVDRALVDAVVAEFEATMDDPSVAFPRNLTLTLDMIEGQLSPEVADELRHTAGLSMNADPWDEVGKIPLEVLTPALLLEGMQVGAIVLSKLPPEVASEALASMPEDVAKEMAYTVEQTGDVRPEVVAHIGRTMRELGRPKGPKAFAATPVERVAEILNAAGASQRDTTLEALELMDADFTAQVRQAIFTFADIPARIKPTDVPTIVRDVPNDDLVVALAAAKGTMDDSIDFILGNMSKRMADQLREEMDEAGPIKTKPGEAAMSVVTGAIRRSRDAGMITFVEPESEEEE